MITYVICISVSRKVFVIPDFTGIQNCPKLCRQVIQNEKEKYVWREENTLDGVVVLVYGTRRRVYTRVFNLSTREFDLQL